MVIQFAHSQITSVDYPNLGDTIYYGSGDASTLNMGSVGIGQTWAFQAINISNMQLQYYVDPTTLPMGTTYPLSNIAINYVGLDKVMFIEKTSSTVDIHGDFETFTLKKYSTPLTLLSFPADIGTYNSTSTTTSQVSGIGIDTAVFGCDIDIDSIQLVGDVTLKSHFDATGILQLPNDTFTNSYRALITTIKKDSLYIYCPIGISGSGCTTLGLSAPVGWSLANTSLSGLLGSTSGSVDSSKYYAWYAPGQKGEVCKINVDRVSLQPDMATYHIDGETYSAGYEEIVFIDSKIYPNPAKDFVELEWNYLFENGKLIIYSTEGKIMSANNIVQSTKVNIQLYPAGSYIYVIYNEKNKVISSGKILIEK